MYAEKRRGRIPEGVELAVVTNSLGVAQGLGRRPKLAVRLIGGRLRTRTEAAGGADQREWEELTMVLVNTVMGYVVCLECGEVLHGEYSPEWRQAHDHPPAPARWHRLFRRRRR